MSVRMLQRALRTQEEEKQRQAVLPEGDHDEDAVSEDDTRQSIGNTFDLLGTEDDLEEVDEEDTSNTYIGNGKPSDSPKVSISKAKKKKKKRGKKVAAPEIQTEEDVDLLLERFTVGRKEHDSTKPSTSSGVSVSSKDVLTVDTRQLRAEDELKRIFGSKVINSVERDAMSQRYGSLRRRHGLRQVGRSNYMKRTNLVTPKEVWPSWDESISMELTHVKDGIQYFKYTYSPSYMETQKSYQMSGALHDHNNMAILLAQHPFHLDSLLALAELYKQLGEYQQSVECLERCIFALECAWHPSFNPFNGSCKLPFEHDANKNFFYALSKQMLHLGRRGCHRSALEVCKLLLNLDADDPLGALFSIDYFALRAEQYEWLRYFVDTFNTDNSLWLLPNFSFSLAVGSFYLELQQVQEPDLGDGKDMISSRDLLKQALLLHPATLQKLVDKAPMKGDAEWGKILKHPHFKRATPGGPSLDHLINLYVERNHLLWRVPELQAQLKRAAFAVIEAADEDTGEVENWACVRQETFSSDHNEYKHLHVSEFSDTAPPMPPEELQNMMFHGGGMENNVNRQVEVAGLEGRNTLRVLLESLLPWNIVGADLHGQDVQDLVAQRELDADEED